MAKWVRLFRAHGIPVYAIFDTDSHCNEADRQRSHEHADEVLAALEVGQELVALPNQLTVSASYACFDGNYERAMGSMFEADYAPLERAAVALVGRSKQLKARYCARTLPQPEESPGWDRLGELAAAIRNAMPDLPAATPQQDIHQPGRTGRVARTAPRP